jgi:deoxycytidine triphosphate deaminase
MSVLARSEIVRRLAKSDDLVITPIIDPMQVSNDAVDLRLGTMTSVIRGSGQTSVDPQAYAEAGTAPISATAS